MNTLKRGTALAKQFRLIGVSADKAITSIEFLFKSRLSENAPTVIYKCFPGDDTAYDPETQTCAVFFREEDTRLLRACESIYMDTRVVYEDGVMPETIVKKFEIQETLFGRGQG